MYLVYSHTGDQHNVSEHKKYLLHRDVFDFQLSNLFRTNATQQCKQNQDKRKPPQKLNPQPPKIANIVVNF